MVNFKHYIWIYRAKVEGKGLSIINFNAKGYKVYDDHYNVINAFADLKEEKST